VRVVIDTNVVVSGIFWDGPPSRILDSWATDKFSLCVSAAILEEYFEVIDRLATGCGREDLARRWKAYLFEHAELVDPAYNYDGCRDPDDAKFVECATGAGAAYVVSGDDDLLTLGRIETVAILSPAEFLGVLEA